MPSKPPKPCAAPGCGATTTERYCEAHRATEWQRKDQGRESSDKRGYGGRWKRYRRRFLRENPLCVQCQAAGKVVPATVVDHITPHRGDKSLFWDKANHQALCKLHHDRKTADEVNTREWGGAG